MPEFQINPPLDPKKFRSEEPAAIAAAPKTETIFPGFLARAGAFAIDLLVLYMLASAANQFLRAPLLALGRGSSLLACAVFIAYCALSAGPLGKGRSLGKHLLQIRVTDREGRILTREAALKRAFLLTAPVWGPKTILWATAPFDLGGWGEFLAAMAALLFMALLLSNALCVAIDPLRRSFHDFLAGSIVVKASCPAEELPSRLAEAFDTVPPMRVFQRLMLILPAVVILASAMPKDLEYLRSGGPAQRREQLQKLYAIVGTKEFRPMLERPEPVAPGGEEAERAERATRSKSQGPPPGPRALRWPMSFVKFSTISPERRKALAALEPKMPELRAFILKSAQEAREETEREGKKGNKSASGTLPFPAACAMAPAPRDGASKPASAPAASQPAQPKIVEAYLEASFADALDLGFTFYNADKPVAKFRTYFTPDEIKSLGIELEPMSASQATSRRAVEASETSPSR